jgi:hypothetical protein
MKESILDLCGTINTFWECFFKDYFMVILNDIVTTYDRLFLFIKQE